MLSDEPKTVRLVVKVKEGVLVDFYTEEPLALKEGAIGDLVIPEYSIVSKETKAKLVAEESVLLLTKGRRVYIEVWLPENPKDIIDEFPVKRREELLSSHEGVRFPQLPLVEIELLEDLYLTLRSTKKARLKDCLCRVVVLELEAKSLNHAYTQLSRFYEPQRRSSGGNIFNKGWVVEGKHWWSLGDLRDSKEGEQERKLWEGAVGLKRLTQQEEEGT